MKPDRRSFLKMLGAAPVAAVASIAMISEPFVSGGEEIAVILSPPVHFVSSRNYSLAEIARIFSVPLHLIDARPGNTWSAL